MRRGVRLIVNVIGVRKAKGYRERLSRNYLKRMRVKKNNVRNVKSELRE